MEKMQNLPARLRHLPRLQTVLIASLVIVLLGGLLFRSAGMPVVKQWLFAEAASSSHDKRAAEQQHGGPAGDEDPHSHDQQAAAHDHGSATHDHGDGHGHDHEDGHGHDHQSRHKHKHDATLEVSAGAWKNVGLETALVQPSTFVKTVSVPAVIAERPGRSQVNVTAPITGLIIRIYPIEGEAVQPGQPLFDLRLTHEDLVTAQRDFLRSVEELDVVKREIARLEGIGEGIISGRRILEQKYEQQKLEAAIHAQRQGLLLHGLSAEQIDAIRRSRELLPFLTVSAPAAGMGAAPENGAPEEQSSGYAGAESGGEAASSQDHAYHVQSIEVRRGAHVTAGDTMAVLADHSLLYVQGQAFEDDARLLLRAAEEKWPITVAPVAPGTGAESPLELYVLRVADHVEPESRALQFYLLLPNRVARRPQPGTHRFLAWRYRPGQRMEVQVPTAAPWTDQIVLPPEAVVQEGAEAFVFEQEGDHFHRVPVHVLYRGQDAVVIDNDAALVGSTVAMRGAYQLHLAIKNKSGGGVDPHHGHSH